MPPTIRPATPDDLPALIGIERESAGAAHWTRDQYASLIGKGAILVADIDGIVGAFICATVVAPDWEIENIVVAGELRRQGIAKALLGALITAIREQGGHNIHLEVRESNQPARRLYESYGFVQTGRRSAYYQHPSEDAILYALGLT